MKVYNEVLYSNTITAGANSNSMSLYNIYGFSCQAVVTVLSAVTGLNIKFQVTNDDASPNSNVIPTWTDLDVGQDISSTGSYIFNYDAMYYSYARISITLSGGQATIVARVNAKGV